MNGRRQPCGYLFIVFVAALIAWPVGVGGAVSEPRVLVIHSYARISWTRDLHAGIVSVLAAPPEVRADYRVEYMDAKHHTSPAYLERFLGLYREKYAGARFDGIILADNHALDLVALESGDFFRERPSRFAVSTTPNPFRTTPAT